MDGASFPTGEYLKSVQYAEQQKAQNDPANMWGAVGQGVGAGMMSAIQTAQQQPAQLQKYRAEAFQDFISKNMLHHKDGSQLGLDEIAQVHQQFVTGGKINPDVVPVPLGGKEKQFTGVQTPETVPAGMEVAGYDTQGRPKITKIKSAVPEKRVVERKQEQGQFDEQMALKIEKVISPLSASSRSMLGVAGNANMRADRALQLLKPGMTPEDKNLVVTDLQGIMKGGAPDEIQLKQGMYGSYYQGAVQLLERITAHPETLDTPETIARLKETVKTLKDVDNKVIADNLGIASATFEPWIKRHPDQFNQMIQGVKQTTIPANSIPGQSPPQQGNQTPSGATFQYIP